MNAAASIAAFGLPSRHRLPAVPLDDTAFSALLGFCEQHRLVGLLAGVIRSGGLPVAEAQHAEAEMMIASWCGHALRAERMLLRAAAALASAGIACRVLKGVALAHTVYREPEDRMFGDVDLLIPGHQMGRAVQVLSRELGATRVLPEVRPGFDARYGKEVLLKVGERLELDLHRVFVDGAYGLTIDVDDLFAPPYRFALGGYELEELPMPQRLLHAAYAATLSDRPTRMMSQRDVVQIVLVEKPNLVDVLMMARRWQCEAVVATAVREAWNALAIEPRPPVTEWAARYVPTRRERVLLASHQGSGRVFTRHLAALLVLPGLAEKVRYGAAIARPQRAYLEARHMSLKQHAERAVRTVMGRTQ